MVKLLLNKGANLSAIDKKERQPIHCAAYLGKQVIRSCQMICIQSSQLLVLLWDAIVGEKRGQIEIVLVILPSNINI